jgi:hypothetical protein
MKAVKVTAGELLKLLKVYSLLLLGTSDVVTTWSLKQVTAPVTLLYTVGHYTVTLKRHALPKTLSDVDKSLDMRCLWWY